MSHVGSVNPIALPNPHWAVQGLRGRDHCGCRGVREACRAKTCLCRLGRSPRQCLEVIQELWRGSWSGAAPRQKGSQEPRVAGASQHGLGPTAPRQGEKRRSTENNQVRPKVQQMPDKSIASRQVQEAKSAGQDQQGTRQGTAKPQASLRQGSELKCSSWNKGKRPQMGLLTAGPPTRSCRSRLTQGWGWTVIRAPSSTGS